MAKLYFRYGTMNSGKSRQLISVWYNYKESGKHAIIMKPGIDTKGDNKVVPRGANTREVDVLIKDKDNLYKIVKSMERKPDCILVDEAQFLSVKHVDHLTDIVDYLEIPVICYGLLRDFSSHLFIGAKRLVETADKIEEIKTICPICGKKATEVIRYVNGKAVKKGAQVVIDGEDDNVEYKAACRFCKKQILKGDD